MRVKSIILGVILALLLVLTLTATTSAHDGAHVCHWNSGDEFGQHHAQAAQEGHLGMDNNPGVHHEGYSICVS